MITSLQKYIQPRYCKTLRELAKIANPFGVILELGVGGWGSGVHLCRGAHSGTGCDVYGVDNFSMEGVSVENVLSKMRERGLYEKLLIMDTIDAALIWARPISLLFIDADHSYKSCLQDFYGFYPHIIDGGFIAFHDSEREGVKKAINAIAYLLSYCIEGIDDTGHGCYFARRK